MESPCRAVVRIKNNILEILLHNFASKFFILQMHSHLCEIRILFIAAYFKVT